METASKAAHIKASLDGFPTPIPGKVGWPWISSHQVEGADVINLTTWPRITIITPSYNQGKFLEETIRSVLLQGYPNLEYMVIDGGSHDNSVDIIRQYEPWIHYWVSEPDRGQANAINKGFERASGNLIGWINSDDLLLPGALYKLAQAFQDHPGMVIAGDVINFSQSTGRVELIRQKHITLKNMIMPPISPMRWHQPGIYVPEKYCKGDFSLDETMRYLFDQDWLCRILKHSQVFYLAQPVALFRLHSTSKTVGEKFSWLPEQENVAKKYWNDIRDINRAKILAYFELIRAAISLGKTHWDRKKGIEHLYWAFRLCPGIVFSFKYFEIALRILFPYSFLMYCRSVLVKLNLGFRDES